MKIFRFIFFAIVLSSLMGCNKKEETSEDSRNDAPEETKPVHPVTKLIREKMDLEQQLESIIAKAELGGHEELEKVKEQAREATFKFLQVQRQHPKLQKYFKKAAGWEGRRSNNSAQNAKAQQMMMKLNSKIEEISATLPEIQSARAAQNEARALIHAKKRELAQKLPAAQEILAKLADIDAKLAATHE